MRAVLQRVRSARVEVGSDIVGQISSGWLILLGISRQDRHPESANLVRKIVHLRAFNDSKGKMNLSLKDIEGGALVVSQFTLYGDCRKGRRPGFGDAAAPGPARELYTNFADQLRKEGIRTATGRFGAHMNIHMDADGPVTLLLDSKNLHHHPT